MRFLCAFMQSCLPKIFLCTCINVHKKILHARAFGLRNARACISDNLPMLASTRRKVRYLLLIVMLIHAHNSVRRRTKLHRYALLSPSESPWQKLYYHGDSSSFHLMTGLTRRAFTVLLNTLFEDNNQQPIVLKRGRPELLDPITQLGLYLFFIGSTMGIKHLCMIFGIMPLDAVW
jgi:hypothetical protein